MKLSQRLKFSLVNGILAIFFAVIVQQSFFSFKDTNLTSMLTIGEFSKNLSELKQEFNNLVVHEHFGHDGRFFYAMARDPFLLNINNSQPVFDHEVYRYRRILYPLLAGGFGGFNSQQTIYGLNTISITSLALLIFALSYLLFNSKFRPLWAIPLIAPATYLCLLMFCSDLLALALSMSAIIFYYLKFGTNNSPQAKNLGVLLVLLSLAVLTKEVFYLVAISLAANEFFLQRFKFALQIVLIPLVPMLLWTTFIIYQLNSAAISTISAGDFNFAIPFQGLFLAQDTWNNYAPLRENVQSLIGIFFLLLVLFFVFFLKNRFFSLLVLPWIVLAIFLSDAVWNFGNNQLRVFAIIPCLFVIAAKIYEDQKNTL